MATPKVENSAQVSSCKLEFVYASVFPTFSRSYIRLKFADKAKILESRV